MADQRFQGPFRDFEAQPSSDVWQGVRDQLDQRNRQLQRQAYGLSGLFLLLLAGFLLGLLYQDWQAGSSHKAKLPENLVLADTFWQSETDATKKAKGVAHQRGSNHGNAPSGKAASSGKRPAGPSKADKARFASPDQKSQNPSSAREQNPEAPALKAMEKKHPLQQASMLTINDKLKGVKADLQSASTFAEPVKPEPLPDSDQKTNWSLGFRGGIARQLPNYKANDPFSEDILQNEKMGKGPARMASANLLATYHIGAQWHLVSGVGIAQMQRQFRYQPNAAAKKNPAPTGNNDNQSGPGNAFPTAPEKQRVTNTTTYLSFPLRLRYELTLNQWRFGLEAGITVRKMLQASGKQINPVTFRVRDRSVNETAFKQWQSTLVLRPSIGYRLGPDWEVTIAPTAGFAPNSHYREAYPVSNRPRQFGIQAGIRYHF